ncbi:MAG: DUF3987 domain-containing protein [Methylophaga sp.]|nr:DUF3987 domain-containing protein [Methylophaga sp.]
MSDDIKKAVSKAKPIQADNVEELWPTPKPLPDITASDDAKGFPFDGLPPIIQQAAREIERFSKVPAMAPAISGLGVLATALGKKAIIVERDGHELNPTFFFVLIAGTGERKSPVFSYMAKPLNAWEQARKKDHPAEVRKAINNNDMIDDRIKKIKNEGNKSDIDLAEINEQIDHLEKKRQAIPVEPSLYTSDITAEILFHKMHERDETYAVMSAEGRDIMEALTGSNRGGTGTGDKLYLSGFSGDRVSRDRVGSGDGAIELVMYKPSLNMTLMIQPDMFLSVAMHKGLRASGLIARLWPVWLPSLVGTRFEQLDEAGLDWEALTPFYNCVTRFIDAVQPLNDKGDLIRHKATFSSEAQKARLVLYNNIEKAMADGNGLDDVRDIASKATSQTCKLALILHLANNPDLLNEATSKIDIATWQKAERLGSFFMKEAIRSQRGADDGEHLRHAKRLLDWLRIKGCTEIGAREIQRSAPRPKLSRSELVDVIGVLTEPPYQWLKESGKTAKGNAVYSVHPSLFEIEGK